MAHQSKSYKKFVATAATATIVASAVVPAAFAAEVKPAAFTDVPSSYAPAIDFVVKNSFSKGLTPTQYGIADSIKRGDAAVIIANAASLNDKDAPASGFRDVPNRAALAINSLKAAGVVNGKSATNFGFADSITRGEAAIMLQKAFDLKGGDTKVPFSDVSDRYKDAVAALMANDVTNGISATQFGTQNPIKRGDFAKFIYALEPFIVVPGIPAPIDEGLKISFGKETLSANGKDNTEVTFTITDAKGNVDTTADDIVLELDATYGDFATDTVTVQNGVAKVKLVSEQQNKDVQGKVTATVIEAGEGHKDLIGKISATAYFNLVVDNASEVLNVVGAESNQADRVTLEFSRNVELSDLVQTRPESGAILYQVRTSNGWSAPTTYVPSSVDPEDVRHAMIPGAITVSQPGVEELNILGFKPVEGNAKAIEVILEKESYLDNNQKVNVNSNYTSEFGKVSQSATSFTLTDARTPEATKVTNEGMRTVAVKFSESIAEADFKVDALGLSSDDDVEYGEFDVRTLEDNRDMAYIELDEYLKAGGHKVQVSSATDWAGNVGSTQDLNFTVAANTTLPAVSKVEVLSPEQFHLFFNAPVNELDGTTAEDFEFQSYDEENDAWVTEDVLLTTTLVDDQELIVELAEDWTEYYNTQSSEENYYNDKFRIVYDADTFVNDDNGLANKRLVVDLSANGSALTTPDTTSPTIENISAINSDASTFIVKANEPVKIAGEDNAGDTLSQEQQLEGNVLPTVQVQFIGTDADGKPVTINGSADGYVDGDEGDDTEFYVEAAEDLQELVDDEDYGTEWKVVVSRLTDDVGNTAATLTKTFTINPSVANPLATPFAFESVNVATSEDGSGQVTIVYTEGVQYKGGANDATAVANYTLNQKSLPTGVSFAIADSDANDKNGKDTVVITFPSGSLATPSNVLNVKRGLVSYDGSVFTGTNEVVIPYSAIVAN